jgi:hypothetical protein
VEQEQGHWMKLSPHPTRSIPGPASRIPMGSIICMRVALQGMYWLHCSGSDGAPLQIRTNSLDEPPAVPRLRLFGSLSLHILDADELPLGRHDAAC